MADVRDFLLEIGCEEMPSAPLVRAREQLGELVAAGLDEAGLAHGEVRTLTTPRRLAVIVASCATATEEVRETLRGPRAAVAFDADGPTRAAEGFARKCGIGVDELVRRVGDDGSEYVFAERVVASVDALGLLSDLAQRVIGAIQWPNYRSQRWGSEHQTFVRPIRWICALFGDEVVPVTYADVTSSDATRGHRVLGPGMHRVGEPAAYEATLRSAFVLGEDARTEVIRAGIAEVEAQRGGAHVDVPRAVLEEVVNLCEWPSVVVGAFDEEFLSVPHEIICESMLSHQRYFPIYGADGRLTREFVIVSNADPAVADTVRSGNERVVRPRLDDAKFFYEEDLKVGLDAFRARLADVVFHKRLGTVLQKSERVEAVAALMAGQVGCDVARAARAAHLAKADLVSQAVIEFTSQQGTMGGYYALAQGEDEVVARAIAQHYRPRFAGDALPDDPEGRCVATADKLDTVCGLFVAGEPPTGSSDPFAVRRGAIGAIAMLRTLPRARLAELVDATLDGYAGQGVEFDRESVRAKVLSFLAGRLAVIARGEGLSADTVEAVAAVHVIDPAEFLARARALEDARRDAPELFDDLATAYARAAHLASPDLGLEADVSLMGDAERSLAAACERGRANVEKALSLGDYAGATKALADLRQPIDRFFDDVLVMDEDTRIRENRLRLLNRFVMVFTGVADVGALSRRQ